MRGMLTKTVEAKAKEVLGRTITQEELRLMPYIQYVMVNERKINFVKVNESECAILADWEERGWLKLHEGGTLEVSKGFWDAISEILWVGYVLRSGK